MKDVFYNKNSVLLLLYKRVDTLEIQAPAGLGKIQLDIP